MLKDRNSSAIVAVSDLERARTFYEDTLGLTRSPGEEEKGVLGFRTGDTGLIETVNHLRAKGVTFERYDFPGMEWRDGVHEAGPVKLAWFKDPDGNILHLTEGL